MKTWILLFLVILAPFAAVDYLDGSGLRELLAHAGLAAVACVFAYATLRVVKRRTKNDR